MKKFALIMTLVLTAAMLTACQSKETNVTEPVAESSAIAETTAPAAEETTVPEETAPALMNAVFEELEHLLGQDDEAAAGAFGGGEENWTEDKSYFIGRIYQVSLTEGPVKAFTSYDNDNKVASVTVYLADGSRDLAEEDVDFWVQALNEYSGSKASYDNTSSEVGSKNWKWEKEDTIISLRRMEDILSIDMVRAVGELG